MTSDIGLSDPRMYPIQFIMVPVTFISTTAFEVDCELRSASLESGMEDRESPDRAMKYPEATVGESPMEGPR